MDAQTLITYVLSGGGTYAAIAWLWQQFPLVTFRISGQRRSVIIAVNEG